VTATDERAQGSRLGQIGLGLAVLGTLIGGGMIAAIFWALYQMYWQAPH
jgi:hypothetical protein